MSCVLFPASYNQCKCISFLGIRSLFLKRDLACPNGREGQNCHSPRSVYLFAFKVAQFLMPVCLYWGHYASPKFQRCNCITQKSNRIQVAHYSRTRGQIHSSNEQTILTEFNCLWFSLFSFLRSWVFQINSVFFLQTIYMGRHKF